MKVMFDDEDTLDDAVNKKVEVDLNTFKTKPWIANYESNERSVVDHPYAMPPVTPILNRLSEIAKHNNISQQFSVIHESGPSHSKTFHVKLDLGTEEYIGEGKSINDAKKNAAFLAITKTNLARPAAKDKSAFDKTHYKDLLRDILAVMKFGKIRFDKRVMTTTKKLVPSSVMHKSLHSPSTKVIKPPAALIPPEPFALGVETDLVKSLTRPELFVPTNGKNYIEATLFVATTEMNRGYGETFEKAKEEASAIMVCRLLGEMITLRKKLIKEIEREERSAICRLNELCGFLKINVTEILLRENGPNHTKVFTMQVLLSNEYRQIVYSTTGEGSQKKKALSEACKRALKEFGTVIEMNPFYLCLDILRLSKKKRMNSEGRTIKKSNLSKDRKLDVSYSDDMNPIAHLNTIINMKEKNETEKSTLDYSTSFIVENLPSYGFVTQASYRELRTEGRAQSKKLSKRHAAEQMLSLLGYARRMPEPKKGLLKKATDLTNTNSHQYESDDNDSDIEIIQPAVVDPFEETQLTATILDRRVKFSSRVEACPSPSDVNYPHPEMLKLKLDTIDEGKSRLRKESSSKRTLTPDQIMKLNEETKNHIKCLETGIKLGFTDDGTSAKDLLEQVASTFRFSVNYTNLPQNVSCFALCTLGLDDNIVVNGEGSSSSEAEASAAFNALSVLHIYTSKKK